MIGYGLLFPLIRILKEEYPNINSLWYADDRSAIGNLEAIAKSFKWLYELGSSCGYFPEESKSILVVKEKDNAQVKQFCIENDLRFTITNGHWYLGGYVGENILKLNRLRIK